MKKEEIVEIIYQKLNENKEELKAQFNQNQVIKHFFIDDLLPDSLAQDLYIKFPTAQEMQLKKSLKEDKYISAQMNLHDPLIEHVLFAFQDEKIVKIVHEITGFEALEPDPKLYAGGLSRMEQNQYLKAHLDNSHDKDRNKYRVLNLLYYVTPNWQESYGGNLQLWPEGMGGEPITVFSKFNRLAVMETHEHSIHGVNQVKHENARCCISNYYFSKIPVGTSKEYFHVTSFYGENDTKEKLILKIDRNLRNFIRKSLPKNLFKNKHYYQKD